MSSYATPGGLIALGSVLPSIGLITVILIALGVLTIVGVHGHAFGYKIPSETQEEALNGDPPVEILAEKMEYSILMLQCLQIGFAKLSILYFYRRLFCSSHKWSGMGVMTGLLIILTILWSIAFFFANLFECGTHFTYNWEASAAQEAKCIHESLMNKAYVYTDFIIDFAIFVLPIYNVWRLQMSIKRRLGVIVVLMLGALTIITSIIKIVIIVEISDDLIGGFLSSDPDIIGSILVYWTVLESGLAVIVACLPTLHSLVNQSSDFMRSIRSMLSITSAISSTGRSRSNIRSDQHSNSSQIEINKLSNLENGMGSQAYAMKNLENESHDRSGIMVKNYVTQDSIERS